jgi:predicted nucleotidyltransferase component of viral defense system
MSSAKATAEPNALERIKRLTVVSMFSDDELEEDLVLKGGNAMDLVHRLSSRASMDLDFSMKHDFPGGVEDFRARVERALKKTFRPEGYEIFDVKMQEKPDAISDDMKDFWGGYGVEFKITTSALFEENKDDINKLRQGAINIGQGKKFLIDISRFEYTDGKEEADFDGYRIYVYTAEMIVCEKLRAICQQLPEYGEIIRRSYKGKARARDFLDIAVLIDARKIDIAAEQNQEILLEMFKAKRVPIEFLEKIKDQRDFHKADFASVLATVKPGQELKDFDFYFDNVLSLVEQLKSLWNK